jgi:hypothetical protein
MGRVVESSASREKLEKGAGRRKKDRLRNVKLDADDGRNVVI